MTVRLSPLAGAGWQLFDDSGTPLSGGLLYTYSAGTTTPLTTYTTSAGNVANANPIVLDAAGRVPNQIWMTEGTFCKFTLKTSAGVEIWTKDNIQGINDIQSQLTAIEAAIFADLADTSDVAKGDALIGYKQANMAGVYANAVGQTVHRKLQERVSVFDFMTTAQITDVQANTSLVNVTNAINAAFTAIIGNGGGTLYFPKGTYYTTDSVGNTDYAGVTQEIRIAVEGEPGAVINCNPSVYANTALYLRFLDAKQILVKNLYVKCNTKVAAGISATSAAFAEQIIIDNCTVDDCHAVNNAGVTSSVLPIYAASDAWGYLASVTNCIVRNVTRAKTGLACQGIGVVGFAAMTVANNTVVNVRHSGQSGDKQDADGIVVFSQQNGSGNFQKSAINVVNNHIRDCEGRFIKLQTNGSALVQGNYMSLDGSLELINDWVGVDSQVGDADICDNTARIGTGWTGGASAIMFQPQPPLLANQDYSNEGFFQRVNRNNVEVRQQMSYFCVPGMPVAGVTANHYVEVADNFVNYPLSRAAASANSAFSHFIYLSSGPTPANTNGTVTWKINGNQVTTYNFISITYTLGNYTDKWFMFVYDNYKASFGGDTRLVFAGDPYTNSCMIRDNQMGPGPGRIDWPLDLSKIYDGNDFYVGGQTLTNAPVAYSFSRVYKKGGVLGVQRDTQYYISSNTGSVWTALV